MGETYGGNLWGKPMGETYGGNRPQRGFMWGNPPQRGLFILPVWCLKKKPRFFKN